MAVCSGDGYGAGSNVGVVAGPDRGAGTGNFYSCKFILTATLRMHTKCLLLYVNILSSEATKKRKLHSSFE